MKKATVLAAALAAFAIVSTEANAQSATTPATQQTQTTEQGQTPQQEQTNTTQQAGEQTQQAAPQDQATADNKQQITKEELPEAAQATLQSEALQEWQVSEVYKVAGDAAEADAEETYEVYLTNADQKRAVVRFDKAGKAVQNAEQEQPETEQ